jgi:Flp pilus assembly protein TadG
MMMIRKLHRDDRGTSLVEFAIALPILVTFIWGIFQFGLLFQANAGMQHALGEAARMATIWPYPGDTAITNKVTSKKFGTYNGQLSALQITNNTVTNPDGSTTIVSKDLRLTYTHTVRMLFLPPTTVTLDKSKRVYLAS